MNHLRIVFCFILTIYIYSCKDKSNNFSVGEDLVKVNSDIIINDTATLKTYTIKSDSIITSGLKVALVGHYNDEYFGDINASSYFQLGLPSSLDLNTNALSLRFDSIALVLHGNGFYYGDSTKLFSIEARQLQDPLDSINGDNDYLYNVTKVRYDSTAVLGKITFYPKPTRTSKEYNIKLSDNLGSTLFDLIKEYQTNKITALASLSGFLNYFRGIAMIPGNGAQLILGFVADTSAHMRLYYRENTVSGKANKYFDFKLVNQDFQYNRITDDLSATKYRFDTTLQKLEDKLPSIKSGNQTYVQGGTGLTTRIEFPYLQNYRNSPLRVKLLKAELLLRPARPINNTFLIPSKNKTFLLPSKFAVYEANDENKIGYLQNDTTKQQMYKDDIINNNNDEDVYYSIDITSFIESAIKNTSDDVPALILSLPNKDYRASLKRIILDDGTDITMATKLRIVYWRY